MKSLCRKLRALFPWGLGLLLAPLSTSAAEPPRTFLWAWERPERLTFIDPSQEGVAFHAVTFHISGDGVEPRRRRQPLVVPPGTYRMAVMRIEVDRGTIPSEAHRTRLLQLITEQVRRQKPDAVQVDYDARASERPFYRVLLQELRAALPPELRLSMTALASWCLDDGWLDGLPVDEVVPMVFRMGADTALVRSELARRGDFDGARCRQSVGFVTDEPVPTLPAGRRTYWFNPRSWSAQDLQRIREKSP
ncbi:DUF3142 domain-containing protein [Hyalangium rubrum]|uniref:DUF3142 domain-containing protein n=1 Tax=Hyalangium rubrum TaxID=3103134 RepID=A0ABU5H063_9BACT|nr:DUF3142 domain-containing protein [Hyalangium sp. s54d21]MDY7226835.1 DUF3142 domain-containing protein [Hyalangium sp. s54d21]